MLTQRSGTVRLVLLAAVVVFVIFATSVTNLGAPYPTHSDEAAWSRVGVTAFSKFFVEKDIRSLWWLKSLGTFGVENPNAGKFIIGGSLWMHGYRDADAIPVTNNQLATFQSRYAARLPSAMMFALLTGSLSFLAGLVTQSYWSGIGVVVVFLAHPWIRYHARLATLDVIALTFSTLGVVLLIYAFRERLEPDISFHWTDHLVAMVAWLFIGLAIATKMNALLILATSWVLYLVFTWYLVQGGNLGGNLQRVLLEVGIGLIVVVSVFWVTNPALWSEPDVVQKMLQFGTQGVQNKQALFPDAALTSLGEKIEAFYRFSIADAGEGFTTVVLGIALFFGLSYGVGDHAFLRRAVIVPLIVTSIGVTLWSPLAWARYYLPAIVYVMFIQGMGIWFALTAASRLLGRGLVTVTPAIEYVEGLSPAIVTKVVSGTVLLGIALLGVVGFVVLIESTGRIDGRSDVDEDALLMEANRHREHGDCEKALRFYDDLINTGAELAGSELFFNAGSCAEELSLGAKAIAYYKQALKHSHPSSSDVEYRMGIMYRREDIHWKALQHFQQAIDENKFSSESIRADALYYLALERWYAKADPKQIVTTLEQAVDSNQRHYWALRLLGYFYFMTDRDLELVETTLSRAIDLQPQNASAYLTLANIYDEAGSKRKACDVYRTVLSIDPTDIEASEYLNECANY